MAQFGAPITIGNENNLVNALEIKTTGYEAALNLSDTGELIFTDVNGVNSMSALVAGSGALADYYTKTATNANFLSANTSYATPGSVTTAYNNAVTSASTYADQYQSNNNMYTIQYNDGAGGFAGASDFTFNGTLKTPSITLSGATALIMTDMDDGLQYYVSLSAGTFLFAAV